MPRLPPSQAFEEYMQKVSSPLPDPLAGASAPLSPVARTSPLSLHSAYAVLVQGLCHALSSRRSQRLVALVVVGLVTVAAASFALSALIPMEAHGQSLDAVIEDASTTTVEVVPAPFDAGVDGQTPIEPPPLLSPWLQHLVGHDGGLVSVGLLLGLMTARYRSRRQLVPVPERVDPEVASTLPTLPRRLGATSVVGNTREMNQDRVWVRHLAGVDLCVAADGLGGLPRGDIAAEIALTFAKGRLENELLRLLPVGMDAVRAFLVGVIWEAATKLAEKVVAEGWTEENPGLRTTLILTVVTPTYHVTAWVGDGAVLVLRDGGELIPLLTPHKDMAEPNVLHASLGPCIEGRPSWAVTTRKPGDVLIVATDGVGDVFDAALARSVRDELDRSQGDAAQVAEGVVEQLAQVRDEAGHFCVTDNLTVAILLGEGRS